MSSTASSAPALAADGSLLRPVAAGERIEALDVLRGFALLGILLMNLEAFAGPMFEAGTGVNPAFSGVDRFVDLLVYVFVQGKFWTLFTLLFGMGFAVMSQRAEATGRPFAAVYWRRGLVLLGIGLVHALLIWSGDILVTYALCSFLLLAFRDVSPRVLLVVAVLAFLGALGLVALTGLIGTVMQSTPELAAQWDKAMSGQNEMMGKLAEAQRQAYGSGNYFEATLQRFRDFGIGLLNLMVLGPLIFGMFLLGAWFVRTGAITAPDRHPRLFRNLRWWALPVGLALMLASTWMRPTLDPAHVDLGYAVAFSLSMLAGVLMSLGYAAWVLRGLQSPGWMQRLAWLAPAGRMALTNYLMQSLLCTLVFYGYGLGWFERMPRTWQVPFGLSLFALQVLSSHWWLKRFRFGPMEWLWRSLTYLKPQPMRG